MSNSRGKFVLLTLEEFKINLIDTRYTRQIKLIQLHHTWMPSYHEFKGNNHFEMLQSMERYHVSQAKMAQIAQNITIFPDGKIALCRPIDIAPAGIFGANQFGICIENIGNFDKGGDTMTKEQTESILGVVAALCNKFKLVPNNHTVVYHHWYDLNTGRKLNGQGSTKSCPGTNFFGGNKPENAVQCLYPLVMAKMGGNKIASSQKHLFWSGW